MSEYVIRPADATLFKQAGNLVATVFSGENPRIYERILHDWIANLPHSPAFDSALCRVGMVGDTVVSQALIGQHVLNYGDVQLKVATISKVATDPPFRHRGYSATLIRDALATIAEQGASLAILNDLSDFYHQFGFSTIMPDTILEVDSVEAMNMPHPLRIRHATSQDVASMARLYQRHWGNRITFQRSTAWWDWKFQGSIDPVLVAVTPDDSIQGYLWRENTGNHLEIVCNTLPATISLISFLGKRMQKIDEPRVQLLIPSDDATIAFLKQVIDFDVRIHYRKRGGWMARVIDSSALLRSLLPEIGRHVHWMYPDFDYDDIYLNNIDDTLTIGFRSNTQDSVTLSHQDFVQILFGSLHPMTLAIRDQLPPSRIRLLESLFPPRVASFAPLNWV